MLGECQTVETPTHGCRQEHHGPFFSCPVKPRQASPSRLSSLRQNPEPHSVRGAILFLAANLGCCVQHVLGGALCPCLLLPPALHSFARAHGVEWTDARGDRGKGRLLWLVGAGFAEAVQGQNFMLSPTITTLRTAGIQAATDPLQRPAPWQIREFLALMRMSLGRLAGREGSCAWDPLDPLDPEYRHRHSVCTGLFRLDMTPRGWCRVGYLKNKCILIRRLHRNDNNTVQVSNNS